MTDASYPELNPPNRILLGPGPSNVNPRVLQAMISSIVGYFDPEFFRVMDGVADMLRQLFQTSNSMTLPLSGTGSAGMEAAFLNLLEPGDTAVVGVNGFFGERMLDVGSRSGATMVGVPGEWGKPLDVSAVEREMKKHSRVKVLAVVHAETSTGILQPLEELSRIAKEHDALFLVDAVTSLGGCQVSVDEWGIDFCYSATQKCVGSPPGLSPVTASERAMEVIHNRKEKVRSWYLDTSLLNEYWADSRMVRTYHHTAPTSSIYALYEALRLALQEGLANRFKRHQKNGDALRAGLEALGLELFAPPEYRLNQITPIVIPEGIDDARVRGRLLNEYNIEIGGGLGQLRGKTWRVGLMGESSASSNVLSLLSAMEAILPQEGFEVPRGAGVAAASMSLASEA